MAPNEVIDDNPFLTFIALFEADDDHAVALWAFAPAVGAVVFVDFAQFDQVEVAVGADVVVAGGGGCGGAAAGGRVAYI